MLTRPNNRIVTSKRIGRMMYLCKWCGRWSYNLKVHVCGQTSTDSGSA